MLQESLRPLATLSKQKLGVIVANAQTGIIHSVNPHAALIFGYRKEELVGQSINLLMPREVALLHDKYLEMFHLAGSQFRKATTRRVTGVTKLGSRVNLTVALSVIVDPLLSALIHEGFSLSLFFFLFFSPLSHAKSEDDHSFSLTCGPDGLIKRLHLSFS